MSDPLEFDNELIKTLESFPLIFEQICKSKKNLETLKISFKNCQNFVPCQLHSDFRVFKTLLSKNRSNMLDEIQDFFETHFDAKTSFIRSSLSISDYNFALKLSRKERASYLFSRIFKKYRIISSQNTQNKTLTATILEEIHEEFFDFISDYSSCQDDFRKRVKMSEPERNLHIKIIKTIAKMKVRLENSIKDLVLLLSVKNKDMMYYNSSFPVTFFIGVANFAMMLTFYFYPTIPFSVAFGFQLLYRIVCNKIFGRTTKEDFDLWALRCIEMNRTTETVIKEPKEISKIVKAKAKKKRKIKRKK